MVTSSFDGNALIARGSRPTPAEPVAGHDTKVHAPNRRPNRLISASPPSSALCSWLKC
jgi:hypothetical protein